MGWILSEFPTIELSNYNLGGNRDSPRPAQVPWCASIGLRACRGLRGRHHQILCKLWMCIYLGTHFVSIQGLPAPRKGQWAGFRLQTQQLHSPKMTAGKTQAAQDSSRTSTSAPTVTSEVTIFILQNILKTRTIYLKTSFCFNKGQYENACQ